MIQTCSQQRYEFPWSPSKYVPFYGGAEYHDYHHFVGGKSQSNFASVFTYCDYLYGTNKLMKKSRSDSDEQIDGRYDISMRDKDLKVE
ncbi:hypothetical protein U1Q18_023427 [Sarracenia purpurea var. burkii]